MQAGLLAFILHVATSLTVHVINCLEKQLLQLYVVSEVLLRFIETHLGNIHRSAILMTRVGRCIHITTTTKLLDMILCAVYTGDDKSMSTVIATVVE